MTSDDPTADRLARDPDAFLPPRFRDILGDDRKSPDGGDGPPTRRDAATGVFYRPDELITVDQFAEPVARFLSAAGVEYEPPERVFPPRDDYQQQRPADADDSANGILDEALAGVTRFRLTALANPEQDSLQLARDLKRAAADVDSPVPADITVGPHVVLTLAPTPAIGPGSDPLPALREESMPCAPQAVDGRPIGVVDTGLWKEALAWGFAAGDLEQPPAQPGQVVPSRGSGHGGFIAWIINCTAPGTKVVVRNAFVDGGLTEEQVVTNANALIRGGLRVLNLSLGTKADTCFDTDLVILLRAMEAWSRVEDLLVVAAAGNDASSAPWYPAGYAATARYRNMVVSVGALERDEDGGKDLAPHSRVAKFSNYGDWVTAWAPGVDLVSAYPPDVRFQYLDASGAVQAEHDFPEGVAKWSGTSFATPIVAARIAALSGDANPRDVWAKIRRGRPFVIVWPDWFEAEGDPCIPPAPGA